jgi:hypothetical protein
METAPSVGDADLTASLVAAFSAAKIKENKKAVMHASFSKGVKHQKIPPTRNNNKLPTNPTETHSRSEFLELRKSRREERNRFAKSHIQAKAPNIPVSTKILMYWLSA